MHIKEQDYQDKRINTTLSQMNIHEDNKCNKDLKKSEKQI